MESLSIDSPRAQKRAPWRLRGASLKRVLVQQDWGSLAATVAIIVGLIIARECLGGPRSRPFQVTDATIAYPQLPSTIPDWVVVVVGIAAIIASILAAELWLARRGYADASDALAACLYFFLDAISAIAVTVLATEVTKRVVGRLRPNFLAICDPVVPNPVEVSYGEPAADNPACTAAQSSTLTDARYSFPSGHTSSAFVLSVWVVIYCVWAFNVRRPRRTACALAALALRDRLLHSLGAAAGLFWCLFLLGWAWAVGVSRITDFKHHVSDVLGGAFLGTLVASFYAIRSISRLDLVVLSLPGAEPAANGGCATSDGCSANAEPGASLLHGAGGARMYQEQCSV